MKNIQLSFICHKMKSNHIYFKLFIISVLLIEGLIDAQSTSGCATKSWEDFWKLTTHSPSSGVIKLYTKGHGGRVECLYAEVGRDDLDTGTGITPAMREHVRQNQDANNLSDIPAQIVLMKLGGSGNVTFNVFPQNGKRVNTGWKNRAQQIYDDLKRSSEEDKYKLTYKFQYDNQSARPKRPTAWNWHILAPNGSVFYDKFANPVS